MSALVHQLTLAQHLLDPAHALDQDVITGLFLLLENAMQIGDWVTVSGLSGTVENLSVRTIRLRAGDGSVHVIPFSSVTSAVLTWRNSPESVSRLKRLETCGSMHS